MSKEEPPDPGGSFSVQPPSPACYVTVNNNNEITNDIHNDNDSVMGFDSDASHASASAENSKTSSRKRSFVRQICKTCNKKTRHRNNSGTDPNKSCKCDSDTDSPTVIPEKVTPNLVDTNATIENPGKVPIGRKTYQSSDASPYLIHVQRIETSPSDNTTLHPVTFGNFLLKQKYKNIVNGSVKRIGRNRIAVAFSNFIDANAFISDANLTNHKLRAFIPTFNITRMGLIRGVPDNWSPEEVIENIKVPIGCGEIIKVRRLNYKVMVSGAPVWKPSQTVVLTFDGQTLPKKVFMCYNALPVELYIFPTIQCYNCCRFGHTKIQCRSKPCCYKCGQGHTGSSCDITPDDASCSLCAGHHFANSRSCPELDRQKRIKHSMATSSISYAEASKLHPAISKSFADVVAHGQNNSYSQSGNQLSTPGSSPTKSYKKTILQKPRPAHILSKGYDQEAHKALIKDYNMTLSCKGCAANNQNMPADNNQNNTPSTSDIIIALLNYLTQTQSNKNTPSNVAPLFEILTQFLNIHNGQSLKDCSVELPQHSQ
ncbi:uncharacterized protein [Choristoneura fumiferana]|uniref:uncharacterized protein n=1 Tax=Choristoneura fumiferana TaxID=7141 RepID=UPI003D15839B